MAATASSAGPSATLPDHIHLDAGLLLSVDSSPLPSSSSTPLTSDYLRERTQRSVSHLLTALYALPRSQDLSLGAIANLPAPDWTSHPCPRSKPLPPPHHARPLTKWQAFAKAKGITPKSGSNREKMEWDEETKRFRPKWGYQGLNKDLEDQWIHELPNRPLKEGETLNPGKDARKERKKRTLVNDAKRLKNLERMGALKSVSGAATSSSKAANGTADSDFAKAERAKQREMRKAKLEADLRRGGISTASMGKFDKRLEGEGKQKGVKRKFEPNEAALSNERNTQLSLLSSLSKQGFPKDASGGTKKSKGDAGLVNVRKAVKWENEHSSGGGGGGGGAKKGRKGK